MYVCMYAMYVPCHTFWMAKRALQGSVRSPAHTLYACIRMIHACDVQMAAQWPTLTGLTCADIPHALNNLYMHAYILNPQPHLHSHIHIQTRARQTATGCCPRRSLTCPCTRKRHLPEQPSSRGPPLRCTTVR